jgi:hypothetical protein
VTHKAFAARREASCTAAHARPRDRPTADTLFKEMARCRYLRRPPAPAPPLPGMGTLVAPCLVFLGTVVALAASPTAPTEPPSSVDGIVESESGIVGPPLPSCRSRPLAVASVPTCVTSSSAKAQQQLAAEGRRRGVDGPEPLARTATADLVGERQMARRGSALQWPEQGCSTTRGRTPPPPSLRSAPWPPPFWSAGETEAVGEGVAKATAG